MKNFFGFFTAFIAMFAGLFSASKGWERKIDQHNTEAYNELRRKLLPFAERFLLPVCKRDKDGVLIKNKKVLKYERVMAERKKELLLKRGHSEYNIGDEIIIALNFKNAERKYAMAV